MPSGGYSSPAYTVDVLNGTASVAALPSADADRIGMWGHSMGGHITVEERYEAGYALCSCRGNKGAV